MEDKAHEKIAKSACLWAAQSCENAAGHAAKSAAAQDSKLADRHAARAEESAKWSDKEALRAETAAKAVPANLEAARAAYETRSLFRAAELFAAIAEAYAHPGPKSLDKLQAAIRRAFPEA